MQINSALYSGVQGFQKAQQGASQAAADINARAAQDANAANGQTVAPQQQAPSMTDSLVRLSVEEINAAANAKTIETADEVLGTLIDIRV